MYKFSLEFPPGVVEFEINKRVLLAPGYDLENEILASLLGADESLTIFWLSAQKLLKAIGEDAFIEQFAVLRLEISSFSEQEVIERIVQHQSTNALPTNSPRELFMIYAACWGSFAAAMSTSRQSLLYEFAKSRNTHVLEGLSLNNATPHRILSQLLPHPECIHHILRKHSRYRKQYFSHPDPKIRTTIAYSTNNIHHMKSFIKALEDDVHNALVHNLFLPLDLLKQLAQDLNPDIRAFAAIRIGARATGLEI